MENFTVDITIITKDGNEFKYIGITSSESKDGLFSIRYSDENNMARYDRFPLNNIAFIHDHTPKVESIEELDKLQKQYKLCNKRICEKLKTK